MCMCMLNLLYICIELMKLEGIPLPNLFHRNGRTILWKRLGNSIRFYLHIVRHYGYMLRVLIIL